MVRGAGVTLSPAEAVLPAIVLLSITVRPLEFKTPPPYCAAVFPLNVELRNVIVVPVLDPMPPL